MTDTAVTPLTSIRVHTRPGANGLRYTAYGILGLLAVWLVVNLLHAPVQFFSVAVFGLSLNVVAAQAPVLTNPAEPADRILPQDGSTTLQIYATGFPSVVYQWFKNGAAIPGATSSSYAISAAIASD